MGLEILRARRNPSLQKKGLLSGFLALDTPFKIRSPGTSLTVQWSRLRTSSADGSGSIPGWGTKTPQVTWYSPKKKDSSNYEKCVTTGLLF